MSIFDRFCKKKNEPEEITLEGIQSNTEKLDTASNHFLQCFGPVFTGTPNGHIATDIAGASSIAGLMILRSTGIDLTKGKPGNVILGEVIDQKQEPVFRYITVIGMNMGVDQNAEMNIEELGDNKPLLEVLDMTKALEKPFSLACEKSKLPRLYYPIAAALTAMKLVGAGKDMGILDPVIGKSIAMYYVVAGSKTIPRPIL